MVKDKFWEKHSDIKDSITVMGSIFAILIGIAGILYVNNVYINPSVELGLCPYASSGSSSSTNNHVCADIANININTDNAADMRIETEVYNKGLFLGLDIDLEAELIGADFALSKDNKTTLGLADRYIDHGKIGSTVLLHPKNGIFFTGENIHILKPSDYRVITWVIPYNFGIYEKPKKIIFTLKERGSTVAKKTVFLTYENDTRGICERPSSSSGIFVKVTYAGKVEENAQVILKDLQTKENITEITSKDGEAYIDFQRFIKCPLKITDVIELKACARGICKIENYYTINSIETSNLGFGEAFINLP